jgi:hypothetical protein
MKSTTLRVETYQQYLQTRYSTARKIKTSNTFSPKTGPFRCHATLTRVEHNQEEITNIQVIRGGLLHNRERRTNERNTTK